MGEEVAAVKRKILLRYCKLKLAAVARATDESHQETQAELLGRLVKARGTACTPQAKCKLQAAGDW